MLVDLEEIKKELLKTGKYLKDAQITLKDGEVFATIYPDLKALQKAHIINIKEQLKWYAIELYNITAKVKIKSYKIASNSPLASQAEPEDDTYKTLKNYLSKVSNKEVFPSSHLEFDLGLDSLEYVKFFMFIEKSYGVYLDEKNFSSLMILADLYSWIKKHEKKLEKVSISWKDLFIRKNKTKLIYSAWIMRVWKSVLWAIFKPYFRFEIHGVKNIPKGPCIIAPNHYSMLDGFVVLASLPLSVAKDTFFLAFEGEFGKPINRTISKHSQGILIDHNKNLINSMQNVALPLLESKNIVIFPEGARSRDGKLLPFNQYFAILSKELQVPIVPAVIKGTFDAMPTGISIPRPRKVIISYLKPIYPQSLEYDTISKKTKKAMNEALQLCH